MFLFWLQFMSNSYPPLLTPCLKYIARFKLLSVAHRFTYPDYFLQFPKNPEEWWEVAKDFQEKLNFPNCGDARDGKHVLITPPANSGSFHYNYTITLRWQCYRTFRIL